MKAIKNLIRWCKMDMVSTIFLFVTLGLFIYYITGLGDSHNAGYWLGACVLFAFNRIVWQGGLVDLIRDLEEQNSTLIKENHDLKNAFKN